MKQFLTAVIIVGIAGGAYWWWQNQNTATNGETMDSGSETTGNDSMQDAIDDGAMMEDGVVGGGLGASSDAPLSATVSYNGSGFSPATVTIKKGGMVSWSNTGGASMWVASAQHPTHMGYDGTNLEEHCPDNSGASFDQCKSGNSFSFIFNKTGTWRYHDHMNASAFGSVVVVE